MEKKISNDDYIYLLHKTAGENPDFIEDVFNNGLRSWYDTSIHSTLAEISAEDIQKFGLESVMKNYLGNGEDYNSVFLIKIPKEYMISKIHRDGKVSPPVPFWKDNGDKTTTFTPHLIQGVYCRSINKGITNPNFSPVFDPTGLKYADEQIDNMWGLNQMQWIQFAKSRKNLSFEQLVQIDNKQKNWERLIKHYSDMFGVIPSQSRFIMSENDRIALENNKSSKKR